MKNLTYLLLMISGVLLTVSCNDSTTDEFEEANGNVENKLIKSISTISAQNSEENINVSLTYDSDNRLSTITDGNDISIFVFDNGNLSSITGPGENFNIEDLSQSPYDAFETGQVLEYDSKGNPIKVLFFEEEYNDATGEYENIELTAEITYDDEHNPYFYTLEAAGIIEILDDIELNFSLIPQSSEIVQARALFPVSNPSKIVYKDELGAIVYIVIVDYVYDNDDYPTSATVTASSIVDNEVGVYTITYQYIIP